MASIKLTGDTSGEITIAAPAVAGTNTITLPASTGTMITSDNISSYASNPPSGAASITLNSGNTNETLTSSSDQLQFVFPEDNGYSITMPDATTLTKGDNTFVFYNPTGFYVLIKDNGSTVREYLAPNTTISFKLKDNSTSNGVWVLDNPVLGAYASIENGTTVNTSTNLTGAYLRNIIKVSDTEYLLLNMTTTTGTLYAKLLTVNTTTKAITWGNEVTAFNYGSNLNYYSWNVAGDSNGVDKGVITLCYQDGSYYYRSRAIGFAIVSGTLYTSSAQTLLDVTTSGARGSAHAMYCGSDDAFLCFGGNGDSGKRAFARGAKITVSGTTVTTTLSTGSYASASNLSWSIAPTSLTSLVVDDTTNVIKDYVNYVPATNTLTSGVRTSQTSVIVGLLTKQGIMPPAASSSQATWGTVTSYLRAFFCGRKSLLINSAGTKVFWHNKILDIANAGTASVTVSNASFTTKPYLSSSYSTVTTPESGLSTGTGGLNDSLTVAADDVRILDYYTSSFTSLSSAVGRSDIYLEKVDPTVSTFNLNYGAQGYVNYTLTNHFAWYLSNGSVIAFSFPGDTTADGTLDIFTAATLFEG